MVYSRVFILLGLVVNLYICQDEFHCKPKPGCQVAKCSPSPMPVGLENNEFPLTCTSACTCRKDLDDLRAALDQLKNEVQEIRESFAGHVVLDHALDCEEGFLFKRKCYFAIMELVRNRKAAEEKCRGKGANLGDIINLQHQDLVETYLRTKIPPDHAAINVWTAMQYQSSGNVIRLSNGDTATLHWLPGKPTISSTGITILAHEEETHSNQGIFNMPEGWGAFGALCEK